MNNKAISPVMGIILLLAITVVLAAVIGAFVLDIGSTPEYTPNAGVDVNQDKVTLIDKNDDAQEVLIEGPNGSQKLENVGETERLANKGTYKIIAVAPDGETRQVIQTIEIEQADEDYTLLDQEEGDIKGKVLVNPPVEGAKVTVEGVGTTTTDENGIYSFKNVSGVENGDSITINVEVNGFTSSELPGEFHAKYTGYETQLKESKANIEFNNYKTTTINGNSITTSHSVEGESEKQIHNEYQLSKLGNTGTYTIKSNIDARNISSPVSSSFEGVLNGNEKTINQLNNKLIDTNKGTIKDLTIKGSNNLIETTIANNNEGEINNVKVNNGLVSKAGLVKTNNGIIKNSEYDGTINAQGNNKIGGIASINKGEIKNVVTTGEINNAGNNVGGIVGMNKINTGYTTLEAPDITGSLFTTQVKVKSIINNSNSQIDINSSGNNVGGIAGETTNKISNDPYYISKISNTNYNGNINSNNNKVGGLVGFNKGILIDSSVSGTVIGNDNIGGSVGVEKGSYNNIDSSASVEGNNRVGGLVGTNKILSGEYDTLAGSFLIELYNSYSIDTGVGTFTIQDSDLPLTEISDSSASGSVNGTNNIGAVVGVDNVPDSPLNSQHTDLSKVNIDIIEGKVTSTINKEDVFDITKNNNAFSSNTYDINYISSSTFNTYTVKLLDSNGGLISENTINPYQEITLTDTTGFGASVEEVEFESGGNVYTKDVSSMSGSDTISKYITKSGVNGIDFEYISQSSASSYNIEAYDKNGNSLALTYLFDEGEISNINTGDNVIDEIDVGGETRFVKDKEVGDEFTFKFE